MEKSFEVLGRAVFVGGIIPASIWLFLNTMFFAWPRSAVLHFEEQALSVAQGQALTVGVAEAVIGFVGAVLIIGIFVYAFNRPIITLYEGAFPFQRGILFRLFLNHHPREQARMYDQLVGLRAMRGTQLTLREAMSVEQEIRKEHAKREREQVERSLPAAKEHLKPTLLGNVYGLMEEYSFEHYRMDHKVFYHRLLAVIPEDYRALIGNQKTMCDCILNTSFLLSLFALQALAAISYDRSAWSKWGLIAALCFIGAYLLYRVVVSQTRDMGRLIMSAFDLYRTDLLHKFGFKTPATLAEEQELWIALTKFIRRGEDFYYPTQPPQPSP